MSEEAYKKMIKSTHPENGDVLYTKVGATYGIPAYVDTDKEFCLYVSVCLIKPKHERINARFLSIQMGMPSIKHQADARILIYPSVMMAVPVENINEYFRILAVEIHKAGIGRHKILVVGGAAMALKYHDGRSTVDIDICFRSKQKRCGMTAAFFMLSCSIF